MLNASIIIVEDEAIIAADLSRKVERMGFQVLGTAGSAEEAVEIARRVCPQLALMDINLDGPSNGIAAAKIIQELCDNLPVIFLSGEPDIDSGHCTGLSGPCRFIAKPFERQTLVSEIKKILNPHQSCAKRR